MTKLIPNFQKKCLATTILGALAFAMPTHAQEASEWDISGFLENATYNREGKGFTKIRNTLQIEAHKDFATGSGLFSSFGVTGILRGSYDAVYDISDDYGKGSGSSVFINGIGAPAGALGPGSPAVPGHLTPFGQSIVTGSTPGLPPTHAFGFDTTANPNSGLAILGADLHGPGGSGVILAYATQPCDIDPRGCIDGYLDYTSNELKFSEFNDELDFIRELYVDATLPVGDKGTELDFRIGKQQVVWGRTDLFRVLDVINPVDFSRQNIYDELEDIRIPQWIATAEARFGAVGPFSDFNIQAVYNFDKFRPNNLGQGGTPYNILDAGSFFRAMNMCWEDGCSVGNFAGGGITTDFGPGQIGIRQANLPSGHDQWGLKVEGVMNEIGFSLNYYDYHSQLPSLRGGIPAQNSFTGQTDTIWPYLIAFDIDFPDVKLYGGSLDIYNDTLGTAIRLEAAYTTGEEFANTLRPELFSESDVLRYVIGVDRTFFVPGMPSHAGMLVSGQIFGQHILDHELAVSAGQAAGIPEFGAVGIPDWKDNWIATLLLRQTFKSGLLGVQAITAYDVKSQAGTFAPSIDYNLSNHWKVTLGVNVKWGSGPKTFDDCRSCNPFTPFTATGLHPVENGLPINGSVGLSGFEPLGRFRNGPIGSALAEDEIQLTVRYSF